MLILSNTRNDIQMQNVKLKFRLQVTILSQLTMKMIRFYENIYNLKMILCKITIKNFFAHYYFASSWHLIGIWKLTEASCIARLE